MTKYRDKALLISWLFTSSFILTISTVKPVTCSGLQKVSDDDLLARINTDQIEHGEIESPALLGLRNLLDSYIGKNELDFEEKGQSKREAYNSAFKDQDAELVQEESQAKKSSVIGGSSSSALLRWYEDEFLDSSAKQKRFHHRPRPFENEAENHMMMMLHNAIAMVELEDSLKNNFRSFSRFSQQEKPRRPTPRPVIATTSRRPFIQTTSSKNVFEPSTFEYEDEDYFYDDYPEENAISQLRQSPRLATQVPKTTKFQPQNTNTRLEIIQQQRRPQQQPTSKRPFPTVRQLPRRPKVQKSFKKFGDRNEPPRTTNVFRPSATSALITTPRPSRFSPQTRPTPRPQPTPGFLIQTPKAFAPEPTKRVNTRPQQFTPRPTQRPRHTVKSPQRFTPSPISKFGPSTTARPKQNSLRTQPRNKGPPRRGKQLGFGDNSDEDYYDDSPDATLRLPDTNFDCGEMPHDGLFADMEAGCQMFHMCHGRASGPGNAFMCPVGTLFDQRYLICNWWDKVDCPASADHFGVDIYDNNVK